jgi:hypothetical protein
MPDATTTEAIKHVRAVHSAFGEAMSKLGDIEGPGPVEQVALHFGAFGFRQVQAIIALTEASDKLHLQVGQLLRSLLEGPPNVRDGMEAQGRPDRYILYRWNSDVVHVSTTGLGQLVDRSGPVSVIGGIGRPDHSLARLAATWDVASDFFGLVANALDMELPGWEEQRRTSLRELTALTKAHQEEE